MKATTKYARNKLQERFVSAETITKTFGIEYPSEAKKALEETFPDEDFIDYLSGNHGVFIAGPWRSINCYEIAGLNSSYLRLCAGEFCDSSTLNNEIIGPVWLAFSKFSSSAEYHYGTLEKQQNYFLKNNATEGYRKEGFLSVAEMLWAIGVISSVYGMREAYSFFSQNFEARTGTDSSFDGRKIFVMNREGIMCVGSYANDWKARLCIKFIETNTVL